MPKLRNIEDMHLLESKSHQHILKIQCFYGISLKAGKITKTKEERMDVSIIPGGGSL